MSIRTRIWCTLLLAVVLPVGVCLYLMGRTAYEHAIRQAEELHDERAMAASKSLNSFLGERLTHDADALLQSGEFVTVVGKRGEHLREHLQAIHYKEVRDQWQTFNDPKDERMGWFYHSMTAQMFKLLQSNAGEMKDFLYVYENGLPIGGTEKPQRFDQSQEEWLTTLREREDSDRLIRWEKGREGPRRIEILAKMRESSGLLPSTGPVVAYLKLSVDFDTVFQKFLQSPSGSEWEGIVTDAYGKILVAKGIFNDFAIGEQLPLTAHAVAGPSPRDSGYMQVISTRHPERKLLVGRSVSRDTTATGDLGLQVFCGSTMAQVVGPLRKKQWQLFGSTFAVIALGAVAASIYMRRTISRPIEKIGNVTDELMVHSQYGGLLSEDEVEEMVAPLRGIKTNDELKELAERFSKMSVKALGFQRVLEYEVAEKTRLLQDDLEMAREFQQALLPSVCPECGCTMKHNALSLDLAHFYQPAAYVGGDFYDYIPVNGHQVAVLIGDVMGHGARSALVTAILRALIEDVRTMHIEPGSFLSTLNQRYHELIERSGQTVFVSACYLLFDTEKGVVCGASAGHPPPLRARRGGVDHLLTVTKPKFPLGVMADVQYQTSFAPIAPDDLILLYTDGITEAENDSGTQFGERALIEQISAHRAQGPGDLVRDVAKLVKDHARGIISDDVCMVAIRVMRGMAA